MMPFTWLVLGYLGLVVLFAVTADLLHPAAVPLTAPGGHRPPAVRRAPPP